MSNMQKYIVVFIVGTMLLGVIFAVRSRNNDREGQIEQSIETTFLKSSEFAGTTETMTSFGLRVFEIKIPDGWAVESSSFKQGLVFADQLDYKPGTKYSLTDEESGLAIARFNAGWGQSSDFPDEYDIYTKKALPNINGHRAEFYEHTFAEGETVGSYVMKGGEKEYVYRILDGGNEVVVSYFVLDDDEENKDLIESVASTVKLL